MTSDSPKFFDDERQGDTLIVTLQDAASELFNPDLRAAWNTLFRRLGDPDIVNLLVDFGNVTLVGSEIIGLIAKLARSVRNVGGQAVLCNISDEMQTSLNTLKLDYLWRQVPSREEALQSLRE